MNLKQYLFYYTIMVAPLLAIIFLTPSGAVNSICKILLSILTLAWGLAHIYPIFKNDDDGNDDLNSE